MTTKRTTRRLVLAAALAACAAGPALSCGTGPTPQQAWYAIEAALPRVELSDTNLAKVSELRAKAVAALAEARRQVARTVEAAKYQAEAEQATRQAIRIVGLVWAPPQGGLRSGCGGSYRLKNELEAR